MSDPSAQKTDSEALVLPHHLGFILDGNRRWAKANKKSLLEGHRMGMETFRRVALAAFDKGIPYVSAYVFSSENWRRSQEEVGYLMRLVIKAIELHLDEFAQAGIKIIIVGSRDGLTTSVKKAIDKAQESTKANKKGTLALCFNYGGQEEIVDAAKKLLRERFDPARLTTKAFAKALYAPELPELDLIIRTSGEYRTSGYLLWRAAYAELAFVDTLWPDFSLQDLNSTLRYYSVRQRRFGA